MRIFISHITEESDTARVLKSWLESIFLGSVDVFVSSEPTDIKAGEKWLNKIEEALSESKCLLVLCSLQSINRPWVNFETGSAWIKGIPIIPICHSGISKGNLPMPLTHFQALEVSESEFSKKLVQALIDHLGFKKMPKISYENFNQEVLESIDSKNFVDDSEEELGLLDHFVIVDEGFIELANIANSVSDATERITQKTQETQQEFELAKQDSSQGSNKRRQRIAKDLAKPMNEYNEDLEDVNSRYENEIENIETSLYSILKFEYDLDEATVKEFEALSARLNNIHHTVWEAMITFNGVKEVLDEFPKLQRKLNQSIRKASQEIDSFIQNLNTTLDVINRARTMIKSILHKAS